MPKDREAVAVEASVSAAAAPSVRVVAPRELRFEMVVRGYRRSDGRIVHLAPRRNAPALCGVGHVARDAIGATESDVCSVCLALTRGDS